MLPAMGSQTLALFFRALRVDARLLQSHLLRLGLVVFVVVNLLWAHGASVLVGAPGLDYFRSISYVNFAFATLAGPLLFATCITEEKEEQTLGLLRMANVGALSLLLGKLAPRLASALLIVSVQFPFTLLAITLGGVTWLQVHAVFWSLMSHTFFVATVGLLCSVVCRRTSSAAGLTAILLGAHVLGSALSYWYFSSTIPPPGAGASAGRLTQLALQAHSIGLAASRQWFHATAAWKLYDVLKTGFGGSALNLQVFSNVVAGGLLFGAAWLVFDVFNRNVDPAAPRATRSIADWLRRKGRSAPRAWRAAIVGKDFRFGAGGYGALAVKLLTYGPVTYLALLAVEGDYRRINSSDFGRLLMFVAVYILLPIESVLLASRIFRSEIKERTWSMLYMLPRSLAGVAYSKVAGTALALAPAGIYFLVGAALYPAALSGTLREFNSFISYAALLNVFAQFLLILHLVALFSILTNSWTGLLLGLLIWILGLWLIQMCIFLPLMLGVRTAPGFVGPSPGYFAITYGISAMVALSITLVLHWLIGRRLRAAAAE